MSLSWRAVKGTLRQPQSLIPSLFFPLFFVALNTASMGRSIHLPGFPKVDSFLDFAVPSAIIQGVLFGATTGGIDMATDIQDGFFDRLLASPVSRSSILIGRLAGAGVLGAIQAIFYIVILLPFGARVKGGIPAVIAITLVSVLLATAIGGFAITIALRTGSAEVVQATFPVFFIGLFISSAFFPRTLMHGWFRTVATYNPLSWLIEAVRSLIITRFDIVEVGKALAVAGALLALALVMSSLALRSRLAAS
ncbi:MAG: type transport system permease protein [Acidimicrobiaceae bacterium]|jgi:ABC-2 type transport system permease protein|nr:type transport system permease protein [Acidimicrobiaceae bacterium]